MEYIINKTIWNDFALYRKNTLPYRTYFIPFGDEKKLKDADVFHERYLSDKVTVLSGEWDFCYYNKVSALPDVFESNDIKFDCISVPSCWQRLGYEAPVYINTRYLFKCTPPTVSEETSVGIYRKALTVSKLYESMIISFLGVAGGFGLYVNGKEAGYSEGSHNTAEFEIAPYLKEGENEIVVALYKWCNGTYLECQDMFRETGIFRDVMLTCHDGDFLYDVHIDNTKEGNVWKSSVHTETYRHSDIEVETEIYFGEKLIAKERSSGDKEFILNSVREWSAEIPNVYTYIIKLLDKGVTKEAIRQTVGFRHIEIEGNVFKFNDRPIKLFGVNHHDTNPRTGYVMSAEDYLIDIELMKELNVNCVRTSHYPPDPIFMTMADIYGLYVVDEADIETHGAQEVDINLISNDLRWKEHYLDRVKAMYYRDRNHPSVTMWSLGNESGGIKCQDYCYNYLKNVVKTKVPIHYEAACRSRRKYYDVFSEMYTFPTKLRLAAEGRIPTPSRRKPYFLCEYCHSMGVGPGSFEDYINIFLSAEKMLGGCVWEWADHAVYHEDGPYRYTYGGDHGEKKHDGNFCCDGLLYPDRKLSVSAYSMKCAYRPLRANIIDNRLFVKNINYFMPADGIKIAVQKIIAGEEVLRFEQTFNIDCLSSCEIPVNLEYGEQDDCYLNIEYFDNHGDEIAAECLELNKYVAEKENGWIPITESGEGYTAEIDEVFYRFNKKGEVIDIKVRDKVFLQTINIAMSYEIYRAAIDNYMNYDKNFCKLLRMDKVQPSFRGAVLHNGKLVLKYKLKLWLFTIWCNLEIRVTNKGELYYKVRSSTNGLFPTSIPKLGIKFDLPKEYSNVEYLGYGDKENYVDMHNHCLMGVYRQTTSDFYTDYIKPQDNGNRYGVRWAKVASENGEGLMIKAVSRPFEFKADNIDNESLRKARHTEDVKITDRTNVYINGYVRGCGSNSCGPDVMHKYYVPFDIVHPFVYEFTIKPII